MTIFLKHDVIPESLKNMLLVMETTGLFNQNNPDIKFSQLCSITKDRIESFLPGLWEDLFRINNKKTSLSPPASPSPPTPPQPSPSITQSVDTNKPIEIAEKPVEVTGVIFPDLEKKNTLGQDLEINNLNNLAETISNENEESNPRIPSPVPVNLSESPGTIRVITSYIFSY
jgi:hypothetical protein